MKAAAALGTVVACEARIAGRGPGAETANLGIFLKLPDPDAALFEVTTTDDRGT